ncbi:Glycylpeptide N-tetradecanoyltransferase 1 [Seminavis robusta]|uniref:Glycylpeptide N-tetradecanoyltransferase n=1 Tax=Seminavis robusta TaxID=568900 RepID=A0A9N8H7U5_9STRA|nr:Glycylpeptide N-tetradecanoyltransferase 1 [Seminavis robusta]|eukprot:Sro75_g041400.1 Glycylpeptide N-tetradecanoyltransferase 1 (434) ;mRNA; r:105025-106465
MTTPDDGGDSNDNGDQRKLSPTEAAIIEMMKKQSLESERQAANGKGGDGEKKHAFWDTQPMPHGSRENHPEGPIVPNRPVEEVRSEPYTMPGGFEWSNVNVGDPAQRDELYHLLAQNYVEDDECLFRFEYSQEFLMWALTPPGYRDDFLFGVRSSSNKKLVAFISAIPAKVRAYQNELPIVEINFLCVHKKLRSKRLAPVLIKEITRRVNKTGVFQAVYTAGAVLPVPVASSRYYHRNLNPKKLVKVAFTRLNPRQTMARMIKLYRLPEQPDTKGLRPMEEKDVEGVHKLLVSYLDKFELKILFTKAEVAHWLLPREGVINSYVIDKEGDGIVTDFCSFYHLPSSILNQDDTLFAAYSYYNVATTMSLTDLMRDCLILAKQCKADVFNALNLMDNEEFLKDLKFGKGDGCLQYYIYNWACPEMPPGKVGIVLL